MFNSVLFCTWNCKQIGTGRNWIWNGFKLLMGWGFVSFVGHCTGSAPELHWIGTAWKSKSLTWARFCSGTALERHQSNDFASFRFEEFATALKQHENCPETALGGHYSRKYGCHHCRICHGTESALELLSNCTTAEQSGRTVQVTSTITNPTKSSKDRQLFRPERQ